MSTISLSLNKKATVQVRLVLGSVGGTICLEDSEHGNALILLITDPGETKIRITGCYAERKIGWRGRRQRFEIEMHGIPHDFALDGSWCMAWVDTKALPSMRGLIGLYVVDSEKRRWPVDDPEHLALIVDRLTRPKTRATTA